MPIPRAVKGKFGIWPLSVVLSLMLLSGCVTADVRPMESRSGRNVELGKRTSATVGSPILAESDYSAFMGAVLKETFSGNVFLHRINVPAGERLAASYVGNRNGYCTRRPAVFAPAGNAVGYACFFDPTGSGS